MKNNDYKIDFVVTWVDGGDPVWQADKAKYSTEGGDATASRYRDWDQLRYFFRAIEQNAPWVNKIHFVTYGHLPEWLDTTNPKLNIVNHSDFIPEEFLPVFNSTAIEVHLHRIKGLADHFVYFNDDTYIMKPCKESDFFVNGLPVDEAFFVPAIPHEDDYYCHHLFNDYSVYTDYLSAKTLLKNAFKFVNFKFGWNNIIQILARNKYIRPLHHAKSFLKSSFETIWRDHERYMLRTARSRFRKELNNSPQVFRGYQIITGKFYPKHKRKYARVIDTCDVELAKSAIESGKFKYLCLSDNTPAEAFEAAKREINASFDKIFPKKSSFEK